MRLKVPFDRKSGVYYEVHGNGTGAPLILGFPIVASYADVFGAENETVRRGFLDGLTDRYRVLLADYPSLGKSEAIDPRELSAERVSNDLLSVADAAGFDRFALWGYSWGASAALQLAARSARIVALAIGGWSPLGAPYRSMLDGTRASLGSPSASSMLVLRSAAQYAQWVTYYESLQDWDEAGAVAAMAFPRMLFYGGDGDVVIGGGITIPIATTIRARRSELEATGWIVHEFPGREHAVGLDSAAVVPLLRSFLDGVQLERLVG